MAVSGVPGPPWTNKITGRSGRRPRTTRACGIPPMVARWIPSALRVGGAAAKRPHPRRATTRPRRAPRYRRRKASASDHPSIHDRPTIAAKASTIAPGSPPRPRARRTSRPTTVRRQQGDQRVGGALRVQQAALLARHDQRPQPRLDLSQRSRHRIPQGRRTRRLGPEREIEDRIVAPLGPPEDPAELLEDPRELVDRAVRRRLAPPFGPLGCGAVVERGDDRLLRGEVAVHRARADAGLRADVLDGWSARDLAGRSRRGRRRGCGRSGRCGWRV